MVAEAGKWHKEWARTKADFKKKAKGVQLDDKFLKVFDKQDKFAPEMKKADMMIIRFSMAKSSDKHKFQKPFTKLVTAIERIHKKYFLDLKATYKQNGEKAKIESLVRPLVKNARTYLDQAQDQITRIEEECDGAEDFDPKMAKSVDALKKAMPRELAKAQTWVRKVSKSKDVEAYNSEFENFSDLIAAPVAELIVNFKKDKVPDKTYKKLRTELDRFNTWRKNAKLPSRDPAAAIPKILKDFTEKARRVTTEVNKITVPSKAKKKK